ncbi:MAG: hypothetical protein U0930_09725 [Pirellulales bacterium]
MALGFSISCKGDPLHVTKHQDIDNPPPWWPQCYEEPRDTTWYWREWHSYDDDGTLHMKISGWQADDVRWSGALECPRDHRDYDFWLWMLNESGCKKDLISDTDLEPTSSSIPERQITIACNGAVGRAGFEINTSRAGPLMRNVRIKQP